LSAITAYHGLGRPNPKTKRHEMKTNTPSQQPPNLRRPPDVEDRRALRISNIRRAHGLSLEVAPERNAGVKALGRRFTKILVHSGVNTKRGINQIYTDYHEQLMYMPLLRQTGGVPEVDDQPPHWLPSLRQSCAGHPPRRNALPRHRRTEIF